MSVLLRSPVSYAKGGFGAGMEKEIGGLIRVSLRHNTYGSE